MPFLRNIKAALSGRNFRKFLSYSLVEFVLIFVGITLSLEFSNWNDARKKQKEELAVLKELRTALMKDIDDFEYNSDGRKQANEACRRILQFGKNNIVYHDSLDVIFSKGIQSFVSNVQESAYENLKSKGVDLISNDELRSKVIQVYDVHMQFTKEIEVLHHDLVFKTLVPVFATRFNTLDPFGEMKPLNYDKLIHDAEYHYYLNVVISINTLLYEEDEDVIDDIQKTLKALEAEIDRLSR